MLRSLMLKRLSLLFLSLSLLLWVVKLSVMQDPGAGEQCESQAPPGVAVVVMSDQEDLVKAANSEDPAKWLQSKLHSLMSPTPHHSSLVPSASCPASNAPSSLRLPAPGASPALPLGEGSGLVGSLSLLGELHLRPEGFQQEPLQGSEVSTWLAGVSRIIGSRDDAVLMSLPTPIQKSDNSQEVLSVLANLGSPVIVSLANTALARPAVSTDIVMETTRSLERAGLDWLGLHAKKSHIQPVGRAERVGLLAFCSVHRECGDGSTLPFSPLKYTQKVAKSAISELRKRGVRLVIVLMYWGLETSYFPDEMALSVARQLAALGVSAVLGHHPNSVQGHAYFGDTLVVFSPGRLLSSTKATNYCWNRSGKWRYSLSKACAMVHPNLRQKLLRREQQARVYRLFLSVTHPVVADYVTLRLEEEATERGYTIRRPVTLEGEHEWIRACGDNDTQCLACQQF